jgi:hypothetical protein
MLSVGAFARTATRFLARQISSNPTSTTFYHQNMLKENTADTNGIIYRPMKKKAGPSAGIPRASGERNSPVGNGGNQVRLFRVSILSFTAGPSLRSALLVLTHIVFRLNRAKHAICCCPK